ncbi:MAG: chorismate-binding protein [Pseudomonadota bacterium]
MCRTSRLSGDSPRGPLLRHADGHWLRFGAPVGTAEALTVDEVLPALARAEQALADGLYAVGMLAYEAAPAFDAALAVRPTEDAFPLAWFGFYRHVDAVDLSAAGPVAAQTWRPETRDADYLAAVADIRRALAAGVCYQVNYTQRLRAACDGDPWAWFLAAARGASAGAYLDLGRHVLASASPEWLFLRAGGHIESRPMKGTARRGRTLAEDRRLARALRHSPKERAENLMITDMVRNDLGRIARPGSVRVARLFEVQRHPTVWQMISRVTAQTDAGLTDTLRALFPAASVTGAPKVQAMREIAARERSPRGIYCGTIGYAAPDGTAQFNVAIRTLHVDRHTGQADYGTGSGIVWDSVPAAEARECRLKARALRRPPATFGLIETLRWTPDEGYFLLDEHLSRLRDSALWAGIALAPDTAREALERAAGGFTPAVRRVRLVLHAGGELDITSQAFDWPGRRLWTLALADEPIDVNDPLLFHKTTRRAVYDHARAGHPGTDDVLLWNRRGELTETTVANLAFLRGGQWYTPPLRCGLLPGTYRAALLRTGRLREDVLRRDELPGMPLAVFNSLRGWLAARLHDALEKA